MYRGQRYKKTSSGILPSPCGPSKLPQGKNAFFKLANNIWWWRFWLFLCSWFRLMGRGFERIEPPWLWAWIVSRGRWPPNTHSDYVFPRSVGCSTHTINTSIFNGLQLWTIRPTLAQLFFHNSNLWLDNRPSRDRCENNCCTCAVADLMLLPAALFVGSSLIVCQLLPLSVSTASAAFIIIILLLLLGLENLGPILRA